MLEPHEEHLTREGPAPTGVQVWMQGKLRPQGPSETLGAKSNTNSQRGRVLGHPQEGLSAIWLFFHWLCLHVFKR